MLDKTSEKVLKYALSKYDGDMDKAIEISPSPFNIEHTELNHLCTNLQEQGYLNLYCFASDYEPGDIYLSHKGLKYFELKKKERLKYWLPIVISNIIAGIALITSIISLLMK